ncbi:signal transduction histidine-protein kinase BaeS [Geobacter sp. OR-1]|nr:signal transduction histidine-protein kinase BaeS [Geobacter sp. OR-1]
MVWGTASMALKILDTLKSRLLALLLLIALAGLSSGLLVRELIVRDFHSFISGRLEDRSYWVMARLEEEYATNGKWAPSALADDVVLAYMMGLAVRVNDMENHQVIDIQQAVEQMSSKMKKLVFSYAKGHIVSDFSTSTPYPLFHHGKEIGQLDIVYTSAAKEHLFVARSNRLLLFSLLAVGSLTVLLSIILSRRITAPVDRLTKAAEALQGGEASARVPVYGTREFKAMAETFNRMANALDAQETLRKRLLTNAAHELRTPLTVMRLQVEQMADGMVPADTERLTALMGEMDRFRGVLGALDDLSQAEASSMSLKKQPVRFRSFMEPIVERFVLSAQEVAFSLDVADGAMVVADPDSLSQIMFNLIGNAVKAVDGVGQVIVRSELSDSGIAISVEDSGCGIREEDLPFIFERFYSGFPHGMGIGLAIVKELVEAHGGTMTAGNNSDHGAYFRVFLPS